MRPTEQIGTISVRLALAPVVIVLAAASCILVADANRGVFLALNGLGGPVPDWVWGNITHLGDALVATVLIIPVARRHPEVVWATVIAALLAILYTRGLKELVEERRPPAVLVADSFRVIGPVHRRDAFPSGHSATIFTVLGVCILHFRSAMARTVLFAVATLVAASRIMVGVHWPLDVLFGALGGWLAAWAGSLIARRCSWGLAPWPRRIQLAVLLGASIALLGHDGGYTHAAWLSWVFGLLGAVLAAGYLWASFRRPSVE